MRRRRHGRAGGRWLWQWQMRRQHGLIGIGGIGIGGWRRGLRKIGQRKQHADGARCQDRTQNTNSKRKPAQALSRHAGALRALRHTRLCRRHQLRGAFDRFAAAASFSAVPRLSLAVAIQLHLVQASKPTHAGSRAHVCHAGSREPGCRRRWHSTKEDVGRRDLLPVEGLAVITWETVFCNGTIVNTAPQTVLELLRRINCAPLIVLESVGL